MKNSFSKVECPHCNKFVRKCHIKEIKGTDPKEFWCKVCWRKKHRSELKESLPPIPHRKPGRKPKIFMNALELEEHNSKVKEKRIGKLRVPINHIEEMVLWKQLKSEGLNELEIKERIEKLKAKIIENHQKDMEKKDE